MKTKAYKMIKCELTHEEAKKLLEMLKEVDYTELEQEHCDFADEILRKLSNSLNKLR